MFQSLQVAAFDEYNVVEKLLDALVRTVHLQRKEVVTEGKYEPLVQALFVEFSLVQFHLFS